MQIGLTGFLGAVIFSASTTVVFGQTEKSLRLGGDDFSFQQITTPQFQDFGYFLLKSKWPPEPSGKTIIYVCWENPSPLFKNEMAWTRDSVTSSWQKHSLIEFRGWQICAEGNSGIRIRMEDSGPHTKGLGLMLDGKLHGMVLNVTFQNWSQSCAHSDKAREACIRSISVHEFGHALGFAHEHNRWDRPGECAERPQGTSGDSMLTPYDKQSVMNYCNPIYNNDGRLSALDIASVQAIYGKPR